MPRPKFRGVFTALVTPFRDGALDEAAFVTLVERQIAGGVHGLVPVGTTGETATLSHEEHRRVVELVRRDGRRPRAGDRRRRLQLDRRGDRARPARQGDRRRRRARGDALLQSAQPGGALPPLSRRSTRRSTCRSLVYNVPSRTSVDITNDTLARLAEAAEHRRDQGRHRRHVAGRACSGSTCGPDWVMLSRRRPHRARLHRPRRPRLHLGHVQRRAGGLRGLLRRVPAGRLGRRRGGCRTG